MANLMIQDSFEPYYAGRKPKADKPVAAPAGTPVEAKEELSGRPRPAATRPSSWAMKERQRRSDAAAF